VQARVIEPLKDHLCPYCGFHAVMWFPDAGEVCLLCARVRKANPRMMSLMMGIDPSELVASGASTST